MAGSCAAWQPRRGRERSLMRRDRAHALCARRASRRVPECSSGGGSRKCRHCFSKKQRNFHHQNIGTTRKAGVGGAVSPLHAAPVRSHQTTARRAGFVSTTVRARATCWRRLRVERDPPPRARSASQNDSRRRRRCRPWEDPEAAPGGRPQVRSPAAPPSRGEPRGAESAGFRARHARAGRDDRSARREQGRCGGGVHRVGQDAGVRPAARGDLGESGDALPEALRGCDRRLAHAGAGEADIRRPRAFSERHRDAVDGESESQSSRDAAGRRNGRRRRRQNVRRERRRRARRHAWSAGRRHGPLESDGPETRRPFDSRRGRSIAEHGFHEDAQRNRRASAETTPHRFVQRHANRGNRGARARRAQEPRARDRAGRRVAGGGEGGRRRGRARDVRGGAREAPRAAPADLQDLPGGPAAVAPARVSPGGRRAGEEGDCVFPDVRVRGLLRDGA